MKNTGKNKVIANISVVLFLKAPFYLLYVFTLCFVLCVFRLPDEEALIMLNISFPVVGILAGIAFSWAQCLPEGACKAKDNRSAGGSMMAERRVLHRRSSLQKCPYNTQNPLNSAEKQAFWPKNMVWMAIFVLFYFIMKRKIAVTPLLRSVSPFLWTVRRVVSLQVHHFSCKSVIFAVNPISGESEDQWKAIG
jgi:hypothetical protein